MIRRKFDLTFLSLQIPLDFAALILSGLAAYALRYSKAFISIRPLFTEINFSSYAGAVIVFACIFITIYAVAGLYVSRERRSAWNDFGRLIVANTAGVMVVIATVFFQRELTTSRFIILAVWGLSIVFVLFERLILRVVRHALLRAGIGHLQTVIIGKSKAAIELAELYKSRPILGFTVVRRYQSWTEQTKSDIRKMMNEWKVDEILLADPDIPKEHALEMIAIAEERNLRFRYLADLFAASFTNIAVETNGGIPIIEVKRTPLEGWGRITKRLFDIVFSVFFILLFSPVMIMIAILIKITSKGSMLYSKQANGKDVQRIGENGVPFHYFKFRSMYTDADKVRFDPAFVQAHKSTRKGPVQKISNDPRVTPVGKIIRQLSLDELAEFFLVLKGDMSIVGPRPHLPEEVSMYKPHHRRVLSIKPGITGMAQISGRADLDFEDEVRIDTWYIEHWSPALDLWIILKTPFVILSRKGAY